MDAFSESVLSGGEVKDSGSESPRQRLLDAGLVIFSRDGFHAASTRALASQANVNLSAIPYYFGSKEGLYQAVVKAISNQIRMRFADVVQEASRQLDSESAVPKETLFGFLECLLSTFAHFIIGSPVAALIAPIILREQMHPTSAFDLLYSGGLGQAHLTACRLIARLTGLREDDPEVPIRAHALVGQVLAFRAAREVLLRRAGMTQFTDEDIDRIRHVIIGNCRLCLGLPLHKES